MYKIKSLLIASIFLNSYSALAQGPKLNPLYVQPKLYSKHQYNQGNGVWDLRFKGVKYAGIEYNPQYESYICASKGGKTPGKLVNGYCYYPSGGDERKNSQYYIYDHSNNTIWKDAWLINDGRYAPSTYSRDGGDLSYFCRYRDLSGDGSMYPGKYLPGRGACYYANNGDEIKITDPYRYEILVSSWY